MSFASFASTLDKLELVVICRERSLFVEEAFGDIFEDTATEEDWLLLHKPSVALQPP